jgi:release factor glutamine methyltransferase
VALALRDERPDLAVTASDASPGAIEVARGNAARLGLALDVELRRGMPPGEYDLVLANLPYVAEGEFAGLQPEITGYEPRDALVAGPEGVEAIQGLVKEAPAGVRLALEHAPHQAAVVRSLLRGASTRRDLAGHERVTLGVAPRVD